MLFLNQFLIVTVICGRLALTNADPTCRVMYKEADCKGDDVLSGTRARTSTRTSHTHNVRRNAQHAFLWSCVGAVIGYSPMKSSGCHMYAEKEGTHAGLYYDFAGKGLCKNADCTECQVPNSNANPGPVVYDTQCRNMEFVGLGVGVKAPSWNFIKGECPKVEAKPEPTCRVMYKEADCKGDDVLS